MATRTTKKAASKGGAKRKPPTVKKAQAKPKTAMALLGLKVPTFSLSGGQKKFFQEHGILKLLGVGLLVLLTLGVSVLNVFLDPGNPAVWVVFYFWSSLAMVAAYFEFYAIKSSGEKWHRAGVLLLGLISGMFGLTFTFMFAQVTGWVTWALWGFMTALWWGGCLVSVNYAFHDALRKGVLGVLIRQYERSFGGV